MIAGLRLVEILRTQVETLAPRIVRCGKPREDLEERSGTVFSAEERLGTTFHNIRMTLVYSLPQRKEVR
jgi:hypothetical protein